MFNKQINAVLTVIALSIFADKRVLADEIMAFVKSADVLQSALQSDIPITEPKLLTWFEINRKDIRAKMDLSPQQFEQWFEETLDDIAPLKNWEFINDVVSVIANADGEFHISEKALGVILDRRFQEARNY